MFENGLDKVLLVDLAHGVPGDVVDDPQDLRDLVVDEAALERAPHVHGRPGPGGGAVLPVEDDDGADLLAPLARGHGDDGGLADLGEREELPLHLERRHLLAPGLDDVGRLAAQDEVHVADAGPVLAGRARGGVAGGRHGPADGHVARLEPLEAALARLLPVVLGGHELGGRGLGVAPVLPEDGGPAQLDLARALAAVGADLLAVADDLLGVRVDEAGLDGGEGPADGAVDAVGEREAAREGHAHLGHAEALQEHVAAREVLPGVLDGRREGRRAGDAEPEVVRRDGLARGLLHLRGEGAVGREEAGVDCGHHGEEGDLLLGLLLGGGGGARVAIDAVCGRRRLGLEEGRREALPDGVGVEGVEELDAAAGEERGEDGVDGAVDVVQRQDVQQPVGRGVLPGLEQGAGLGRHDGGGDQDALGPVGGARGVEHHAGRAGVLVAGLDGDGLVGGAGLVLGDLDVLGWGLEGQGQGLLGLGGELGRRQQQEGLGVLFSTRKATLSPVMSSLPASSSSLFRIRHTSPSSSPYLKVLCEMVWTTAVEFGSWLDMASKTGSLGSVEAIL
ncbi:hypothetical protein VMCG_03511 [Cytospora schulzeri]|uniref:Uncharacterized protein n=1 Tax=Cytospora schulzeri TaxID=448051 RepID=A0A423WWN1_9PEZI|nr:hypothetical protein VMCG_03511 [Valsa malicola]